MEHFCFTNSDYKLLSLNSETKFHNHKTKWQNCVTCKTDLNVNILADEQMIMLEAHSSNYHILNCTFYT
jgi:hypothetical protein